MLNLPPHIIAQLNTRAHDAFKQAHAFRWRYASGGPRVPATEPEHVASIVVKGTEKLRRRFLPLLRQHYPTAKISSVFIHQSPYVNWNGGTSRCELGDILLVVRDDPVANPTGGYALLVQTKMSSNGIVLAPDPVQYVLYTAWPTFNVEGSGLSCSLPNSLDYGKYGLIIRHRATKSSRKKWHGTRKPWTLLSPVKPLMVNNGQGLAQTLVSLMQGHVGVSFHTPGHWADLIQFLLQNTFYAPLTLQSLMPPPVVVSRGHSAFLATSFTVENGWRTWSLEASPESPGTPDYIPELPGGDGEPSIMRRGISTILVDLHTRNP